MRRQSIEWEEIFANEVTNKRFLLKYTNISLSSIYKKKSDKKCADDIDISPKKTNRWLRVT